MSQEFAYIDRSGNAVEGRASTTPTSTTPSRTSLAAPDSEQGTVTVTSPTTKEPITKRRSESATVADLVEEGQPYATSASGRPFNLAEASPRDVVVIPGVGTAEARTWVASGVLEPIEGGRGYRVVGQQADANGNQKDATAKVDRDADQEVPTGTLDDSAKAIVSEARAKVGDAVDSLAFAVIKGGTATIERLVPELGSRMGLSPEAAQEKFEEVRGQYVNKAMAATEMDATEFDQFSDWARARKPGETQDALTEMVEENRTRKMRALASEWRQSGAAWSNEDLLSAQLGEGAETFMQGDRVMVRLADGSVRDLRTMLKTGAAKVRRG